MFASFKNEAALKSNHQKTNTLPMTMTSGSAESCHRLTKSSTLPTVQSGRPEISRPILQTATSAAASLISKAPSTGVPQSSILASNHKHDRPVKDRSSRAVAFCDPLTLPSPTNPNTPPIIHQPHLNGSISPPPTTVTTPTAPTGPTIISAPLSPTNATVITPTWSVVTLPKSDSIVYRIEDYSEDEAIVSPDHVNEKIINGFSKIRSKLKQKREAKKCKDLSPSSTSDKGRLRNLEISGPLLQTSLDSKFNLVPVCRAPDVEPLHFPQNYFIDVEVDSRPTNENTISWATTCQIKGLKDCDIKSEAKNSPTKSRRPVSIATSRPSRPTSRPPQPPRNKLDDHSNMREPIYDTIKESHHLKETLDAVMPPLVSQRPKSSIVDSKEISSVSSSDSAVASPQEVT